MGFEFWSVFVDKNAKGGFFEEENEDIFTSKGVAQYPLNFHLFGKNC